MSPLRHRLVVLLCALLLVIMSVAGLAQAKQYHTRNVFFVVMDGVRYSDTFGDPLHRNVPRMWNDLRPQGTLFTNYYNTGVTVTRQGHSTMISGTWQTCQNGGPRMTMPTVFDYYRDEKKMPQNKTWALFGKARYAWEDYSSFPVYADKFRPSYECGIGEGSIEDDNKVFARLQEVMEKDHPSLVYANFGYTDHAGHLNVFDNYQNAIRNVDRIFTELWQKIQADPAYRNQTTLIMVNDHGRHDDAHGGFQHHGDQCEGCQHIMLLVLGPDITKGKTVDRRVLQIDVAPTIGELLSFQTPLATGSVIKEATTNYLGLNRKKAMTDTAKRAVEVERLANRNLVKVVADRMLATRKPEQMKVSLETEWLMRGMLAASRKTGNVKYRVFVERWLNTPRIALYQPELAAFIGSVWLDLHEQAGKETYLKHAQSAGEQTMDFLRTKGFQDENTSDRLAFLWRLARVTGAAELSPAQVPGADRAELALDDCPRSKAPTGQALGVIERVERSRIQRGETTALPAMADLVCMLRSLPEPGAAWPDPEVTALNLCALRVWRDVPWFQQIHQAKAREQMGPIIRDMSDQRAQQLAPQGAKAPRMWINNRLFLFGKQAAPFTCNLLRYQVDTKGSFGRGDDLGTGAFLMAYPWAQKTAVGQVRML